MNFTSKPRVASLRLSCLQTPTHPTRSSILSDLLPPSPICLSRLPNSRQSRPGVNVSRGRRSIPSTSFPQHRRSITTASPSAQPSSTPNPQQLSADQLRAFHGKVEHLASDVVTNPGIPSEAVVVNVLNEYQDMARTLLSDRTPAADVSKPSDSKTAASALLSSVNKRQSLDAITKTELLRTISDRAYEIVQYEPVFITTPILESYVSLQSMLGRPESFPDLFYAYRHKPMPKPAKNNSISYAQPNPDKPAAAVPPAVADAAIDAAIAVRDLSLALATIDATYCTTAYKRAKFLRSALFPIAGLLLTPPAAYTLASRFSDWQTTMDSSTATQVAMAGILTYTTAVATVGYVALTTANDQMVRITWATGLPLWERWIREEERGAIDRVAQAWGFKSKDKWGEEEGEEWDDLKEWVGLRGMVLDRVELMEGME